MILAILLFAIAVVSPFVYFVLRDDTASFVCPVCGDVVRADRCPTCGTGEPTETAEAAEQPDDWWMWLEDDVAEPEEPR